MTSPSPQPVLCDVLDQPVEIVTDRWGVAHISASNLDDVFRAQGWNVARDRLWQIDTWRRRGLGLLSEVLGSAYVQQDRACRLFLYRGDQHQEWLAYGSDTKRIVTAFVQGINAFVHSARSAPDQLPFEFQRLGYLPSLWAPEDISRIRSHGLSGNLRNEVARARMLRDHGPAAEELRRRREPWAPLTVPPGLDLGVIPDDVLEVFLLATLPIDFAAADRHHQGEAGGDREDRLGNPSPETEGSNNWVLDSSRTVTGRPILASDPHRVVTVPSLRYMVHLRAPGLDVIGAGEPALPGVSIGHNQRIAFGLTHAMIDQEDLYVYETNPAAPDEYRWQDRWERMEIVRETIPVRDSEPVPVELAFTRHGPVISAVPGTNAAFAVRATWLQPGQAPYLASLEAMRAGDWDQFSAALNRWGAPPSNHLYADTEGTIAWRVAGLTPVRPNWDGTLPVPGDGHYEWAGFLDGDQLPERVSPAEGWLATANEMNIPEDFPTERELGRDWATPLRRRRIEELLTAQPRWSAQEMADMQEDFVSLPARGILEALSGVEPTSQDAIRGAELLAGWDGDLAPDSAPAALFQIWYRRHLRPGLLRRALGRLVPDDQVDAAMGKLLPADDLGGDARVDLALITEPERWLGDRQALAEVMEQTLADAWGDASELLGEVPSTWSWGAIHRAHFRHPLTPLLTEQESETASVGPLARGGSNDTISANTYLPDFTQATGASFRMVIDVGQWDRSLAVNTPGQSGDPSSSHYADLFTGWARSETFPLAYSREQVDAVAESVTHLVPDPPSAPTEA